MDYEGVRFGDMPICWREWAFEFTSAKASAQAHHAKRAYG